MSLFPKTTIYTAIILHISAMLLLTVEAHAQTNGIIIGQLGSGITANIAQSGRNNNINLKQVNGVGTGVIPMVADIVQAGTNNDMKIDQNSSRLGLKSQLSVQQGGTNNSLIFSGDTNNSNTPSIVQNGSGNYINLFSNPQGGSAGSSGIDQDGQNNSITGVVGGRNALRAVQTATAANSAIAVNGSGLIARQEGVGQRIIADNQGRSSDSFITYGGAHINQYAGATGAIAESHGFGITDNTIEQYGEGDQAYIKSGHGSKLLIEQRGKRNLANINDSGLSNIKVVQDVDSDDSVANITSTGSVAFIDVYQQGKSNVADLTHGFWDKSSVQQLNGNNNLNINSSSQNNSFNVIQRGGATANIVVR